MLLRLLASRLGLTTNSEILMMTRTTTMAFDPFAPENQRGWVKEPQQKPEPVFRRINPFEPERPVEAPSSPVETAEPPPKVNPPPRHKEPVRNRRSPNTGSVPTKPADQNAHAWALLNDRSLKPGELAVAMRLHYYCYAPGSGGKSTKAMATLADECGMGHSTLKGAVAALVRRGYFRRLDSGKGGRSRQRATFTPSLPEWT